MSEEGEGRYLLLANYGLEGWMVKRYGSAEALLEGLRMGATFGNEFILAKELKLEVEGEE